MCAPASPCDPASPVEPLLDLLPEFDMVLVMTVEPGFGGQSFIEGMLPKIRRARQAIEESGASTWLQVDGGVARDTIGRIAQAGANVFVAGSAVYGAADIAARDRRRCGCSPTAPRPDANPDGAGFCRECLVWHDRWRSTNTYTCSGVGVIPSRR